MTRLDKSRGARIVARVLVAAFLVTGLPFGLGPAEAARMNVVVIAFDNRAAVGGQELADRVTDAVKLALAASGRANIMGASPSAPAVRRALEENTLRPEDLERPMDADKASRLGKVLGADAVVFGVVQDYRYEQKPPRATIALTCTKVVVATGEKAELNISGASAEKVRYNGGEGPLLTEAIQDAASKLAAQVVGGPVEKPQAPQKKVSRKKASRWLVPLLVLGAILAASGGGGHEARAAVAAPTAPVTTPLAAPLANAVGLSWGVNPTVAAASFKILRAPAGNAPIGGVTSFIYSPPPSPSIGTYVELPGIIAGTARAYTDTTVELGKLYAYQIKAFVGGQLTAPVDFLNTREAPSKAVGPGVPIRPQGLAVVQGPGALSASVRWTANPEPFLKGYIVYRRTPTVTAMFSKLADVPAGTAQYNDFKDIRSGSQYYYIVAAVGSTGAAGPIEARSDPFSYVQALGQLQPPQNLTAASGQDFIQLAWEASQDPAVAGYKVYRAPGDVARPTSSAPFSAPWVLRTQITGRAVTSFKDTPLGSGQTFSYVATSRDAATPAHESAASNQAHATTSLPPSSVTLTVQTPIPANGISASLLQATVKDSQAHPVAGVSVTFALLPGDPGTLQVVAGTGGTKQDNTVVCPTDGNGVAKASLVSVASATQVTAHVSATVAGLAPATKQVVMTVPKPKTVQVGAMPAQVVADGRSATTLVALVLDDDGKPLPSAQVIFSVDNAALGIFTDTGTGTSSPKTTNSEGKAAAYLRSKAINALGTVTAKATATKDSVQAEGQALVTFIPLPFITLSVNPSQIPAAGVGSTATITATVKDNASRPQKDKRVAFGFVPNGAPTSPTGASIAPPAAITNDAGLAFSTLTSPPNLNAGISDSIRAWIDTDADGTLDPTEVYALTTITYTQPAASVTVTADPAALPADGKSVAKISALVLTAVPNPIPPPPSRPVADGSLVTFTVQTLQQAGQNPSPGTFTDSGTATTTAYTTNGMANAFLKASDATGTVRVTATAGAVSGTVQMAYLARTAQILELSANPQGIPADNTSTSTITAILRDAIGSPVTGTAIDFRTDLGTLSTTSATTDANGRASVTLRAGTTSGIATIVATTGTLIATVQVRLTSGVPAQMWLVITLPSYALAATNGLPSPSGVATSAQVTARVVDRFSNPVIDGTNVFFRSDVGQITATATTQNGAATATLIACDFPTATNTATFQPGIASIEASAVSPEGPPRAGPLHVIFSGDAAVRNVRTAEPTATDLTTDYGASYLLNHVGGMGSEPSLTPTAGNLITVTATLTDGNDNPLPAGVPVTWEIKYGDQVITGASSTFIRTCQCVAEFKWTPGLLNSLTPITKALANIKATVRGVVRSDLFYCVNQWIGAAVPASSTRQWSPQGTTWQALTGGNFSGTLEFDFRDRYGNAVQNGTTVDFYPQNVANTASLQIGTNPATTTEGTTQTVITGTLAPDPANPGRFLNGSFTIVARARTVLATIGINVTAP